MGVDEKTKEKSEPFYNNVILMHDKILVWLSFTLDKIINLRKISSPKH